VVVAFTWQKVPVRVLLNAFNHLPDAVETTQEFHDFWYFWGDVEQRIYFDNFKLAQGIVFPNRPGGGAEWHRVEFHTGAQRRVQRPD
jgi:hypothetical protein